MHDKWTKVFWIKMVRTIKTLQSISRFAFVLLLFCRSSYTCEGTNNAFIDGSHPANSRGFRLPTNHRPCRVGCVMLRASMIRWSDNGEWGIHVDIHKKDVEDCALSTDVVAAQANSWCLSSRNKQKCRPPTLYPLRSTTKSSEITLSMSDPMELYYYI